MEINITHCNCILTLINLYRFSKSNSGSFKVILLSDIGSSMNFMYDDIFGFFHTHLKRKK